MWEWLLEQGAFQLLPKTRQRIGWPTGSLACSRTVLLLAHYLVKCTNFSSFSIFHAYQVQSIRDMDELRKRLCCDMDWISAERGGRCSWSVAKKTESMYPCRSWSLWTFAVTLLAWYSVCHTSQPVLFRATNANPQLAFFRATNVRRNATYLQSDKKVVHFTR